ncbi:MAG: hypothetical protein Q8M20_14110 [Rhodocyclaceae bacterium]|nr:hypothetical protein [Rhodocyclaceae bacterium]MDZ4216135.1 hypothetical protein [Rhodocyclaceae bacterium]
MICRPARYHVDMDLEDDIEQPWWRSMLRLLGMVAGLVALAGVSMAFIFFVAKTFDKGGGRQPLPVFIDATTPPPPVQNARTRVPSTNTIEWPDHPGRGAAASFKGGRDQGNDRTRGGGSVNATAPEKPVPVGISTEAYREAVDSGKKVYLPNPKGDCDVGGQNAAKSIDALDNCFAKQAAR